MSERWQERDQTAESIEQHLRTAAPADSAEALLQPADSDPNAGWGTKYAEFPDQRAAAEGSGPLDVERLARIYMRVRGAHGPNGQVEEQGQPCEWCRLAAEQHVEAAAAYASQTSEPLTPEQRHARGGYDETLLYICHPERGVHHHDCSVCAAYAQTPGASMEGEQP